MKPIAENEQSGQSKLTPETDPCNLFALRKAARAASRHYGRTMRKSGLKESQFSILAALSETGPLSISALADVMGTERTSMSRALLPLQRENFVLLSDEGWRRTKTVSLSEQGKARLDLAMPLWRQAQREFKAQFEQGEVKHLLKLLNQIADASNTKP